MAGHDTLRRDGGWTVELVTPLDSGRINVINLNPIRLDHVDRWDKGQIESILGLVSEMSGVPEATLRQLAYPDVDRVMLAFSATLPAKIRDDVQSGKKPLTSSSLVGQSNLYPVPPAPQFSSTDESGLDLSIPGEMKRAG